MTQEPAAPVEEPKSGGKLKTVLILIIAVLLIGVATAFYIMLPDTLPEKKSLLWPAEGETALEVNTTLSDSSGMLFTNVRFETVPFDWGKGRKKAVEDEFKGKKSVLESILTEMGNSLDSETVHTSDEFRRRVVRRVNEELKHSEIDTVLVKDWVISQPG